MSDRPLWYESADFPCPIPAAAYEALCSMVETPGWAVYAKLKELDGNASVAVGMNPTGDPEDQAKHRVVWWLCQQARALPDILRNARPMDPDVAAQTLQDLGIDAGVWSQL